MWMELKLWFFLRYVSSRCAVSSGRMTSWGRDTEDGVRDMSSEGARLLEGRLSFSRGLLLLATFRGGREGSSGTALRLVSLKPEIRGAFFGGCLKSGGGVA